MTCCEGGKASSTSGEPLPVGAADEYDGVVVKWDVLESSDKEYTVLIVVENQQRYQAIPSKPGWGLKWNWQMDEIISKCMGCETLTRGNCLTCPVCVDDPEGKVDKYSCDPSPTVVQDYRTGLDGAALMGQWSSKANFTLSMTKGHEYWQATDLIFPANFSLAVPGYACAAPSLATRRSYPTTPGSTQRSASVVSYDVYCGPILEETEPDCCVSASAFFNDTIAQCTSCACGCPSAVAPTCNLSSPATSNFAADNLLGSGWSERVVQTVIPDDRCDDYCGVQVHLSLAWDGKTGWSLVTELFNKGSKDVEGWSTVLKFPNVPPSTLFANYSALSFFDDEFPEYADNLVVEGIPYFNSYLIANGSLQYTLVFNSTPGAEYGGATFPTEVLFNGKQCKMPADLPMYPRKNGATMMHSGGVHTLALSLAVMVLGLGLLCL
eukprot:TRINITY_DN20208_c0_g2_i1.p1 TRINITY_DN20208_c0_g2~~TRINITY_DN20208_c0_g2_i1.p1  ORF type:complete len:499 (-),score=62.93 TRINITY_DN20208_c0_g2_i1:754-2064(-)